MILEDLQSRYGLYLAELVRQALTLEEFGRLEVEELLTYFELRSERAYQEYHAHKTMMPPENGPVQDKQAYLDILQRRWQQAEELAYLVLQAEKDILDRQSVALEA